jgi:hypothetical protein
MLHLPPSEYLTFDDVMLLPAYSEVLPADVAVRTRLTRSIERQTGTSNHLRRRSDLPDVLLGERHAGSLALGHDVLGEHGLWLTQDELRLGLGLVGGGVPGGRLLGREVLLAGHQVRRGHGEVARALALGALRAREGSIFAERRQRGPSRIDRGDVDASGAMPCLEPTTPARPARRAMETIERKTLLNKSGLGFWCINAVQGCSHGCRYPWSYNSRVSDYAARDAFYAEQTLVVEAFCRQRGIEFETIG